MKGLSKNDNLKALHLSLLNTEDESVGPCIESMLTHNKFWKVLDMSNIIVHNSVLEHNYSNRCLSLNNNLKEKVLDSFGRQIHWKIFFMILK